MKTRRLKGLRDILDAADIFLLDQWSVLHNGAFAFPETLEATRFLKKASKIVGYISNSSKSAKSTERFLTAIGYEKGTHYDFSVTSGSELDRSFAENRAIFSSGPPGQSYYLFGWDNHEKLNPDFKRFRVMNLEQASFILCAGVGSDMTLQRSQAILEKAKKLEIPLVCSNPDKISLDVLGNSQMCPGAIADLYERMGGETVWFGKPYAAIYDSCAELGDFSYGAKVVAIGDSLKHDIAGGNLAGAQTILIETGAHWMDISEGASLKDADSIDDASCDSRLQDICEDLDIFPDFTMRRLRF